MLQECTDPVMAKIISSLQDCDDDEDDTSKSVLEIVYEGLDAATRRKKAYKQKVDEYRRLSDVLEQQHKRASVLKAQDQRRKRIESVVFCADAFEREVQELEAAYRDAHHVFEGQILEEAERQEKSNEEREERDRKKSHYRRNCTALRLRISQLDRLLEGLDEVAAHVREKVERVLGSARTHQGRVRQQREAIAELVQSRRAVMGDDGKLVPCEGEDPSTWPAICKIDIELYRPLPSKNELMTGIERDQRRDMTRSVLRALNAEENRVAQRIRHLVEHGDDDKIVFHCEEVSDSAEENEEESEDEGGEDEDDSDGDSDDGGSVSMDEEELGDDTQVKGPAKSEGGDIATAEAEKEEEDIGADMRTSGDETDQDGDASACESPVPYNPVLHIPVNEDILFVAHERERERRRRMMVKERARQRKLVSRRSNAAGPTQQQPLSPTPKLESGISTPEPAPSARASIPTSTSCTEPNGDSYLAGNVSSDAIFATVKKAMAAPATQHRMNVKQAQLVQDGNGHPPRASTTLVQRESPVLAPNMVASQPLAVPSEAERPITVHTAPAWSHAQPMSYAPPPQALVYTHVQSAPVHHAPAPLGWCVQNGVPSVAISTPPGTMGHVTRVATVQHAYAGDVHTEHIVATPLQKATLIPARTAIPAIPQQVTIANYGIHAPGVPAHGGAQPTVVVNRSGVGARLQNDVSDKAGRAPAAGAIHTPDSAATPMSVQ